MIDRQLRFQIGNIVVIEAFAEPLNLQFQLGGLSVQSCRVGLAADPVKFQFQFTQPMTIRLISIRIGGGIGRRLGSGSGLEFVRQLGHFSDSVAFGENALATRSAFYRPQLAVVQVRHRRGW